MKTLIVFFVAIVVVKAAYQELECTSYDHPDYGCSGQCMDNGDSSCPGGKTMSGKCPSQAYHVKCCFTADTDGECATYNHPTAGQVGSCVSTSQCPKELYISNLCPTKPNDIKCCFNKPTGTCSDGSDECPDVQVVSRAQWGARNPKSSTYMPPPVDHFVVHHSAGSTCDDLTSCSRVVSDIQDYHMDSNGWSDIGYNFLIGGDGNVYEGRGWDVVGAHAGMTEYNSNGIGVCMLGDFSNSMPTQAALDALDKFVACCKSSNKLADNYNVVGHRDVKPTSCPGDKFYNDFVTKMPNYGV